MSSTTTRKKRSASKKKKAASGGFSRQRKQEILGILLMAMAVLAALAVVTYSSGDDVRLDRDLGGVIDGGANRFDNLLGFVGATLARSLVAGLVGYPVLLPIVALLTWGWLFLRQKTPVFLPMLTGLSLIGALFLACFLAWFHFRLGVPSEAWSGDLGLGVSGWLIGILKPVGSFIVLSVAVLVTVLLVYDRDIQTSLDRAEGAVTSLKSGFSERWASFRQGSAERKTLREKARADAMAERERVRAERSAKTPSATKTSATPPAPSPTPAPPPVFPPPALPPQVPASPPPVTPPVADTPKTPSAASPPAVDRAEPAFHVTGPTAQAETDLDAAPGPTTETPDFPYQVPSIELLEQSVNDQEVDLDEIETNKQVLLDKLETYNIQIEAIEAVVGPTVTRYELTPAAGVKISRITALEDDLAMALAASGIRIIAPIPGKSSIGVEIPNKTREMVRLRQLLATAKFRDAARGSKMALPAPIGKTIEGDVFMEDLAKMPHLLVARCHRVGQVGRRQRADRGPALRQAPRGPEVRDGGPEKDRAQRLRRAAQPLFGDA